ncbi:ABC transporter ATP-binding protein [Streptomyces sp. NPDC006333]|uniref:ABC transporter ATP-binding protein n=1 Tax=Streptomyces sp. NPDC006333 TaxID=3156753 RepID=UPI0033BD0172
MTLQGLIPAGIAYSAGLLVDGINEALDRQSLTSVVVPVLIQVGILLAGQISSGVVSFTQNLLEEKFSQHIDARVGAVSANVSLTIFEDGRFSEQLAQIGQQGSQKPILLLLDMLSASRAAVTLASLLWLLLDLKWWLALVVLITPIPSFLSEMCHGRLKYDTEMEVMELRRSAFYYSHVIKARQEAQEVRLHDLGRYFLGLNSGAHQQVYNSVLRVGRNNVSRSIAMSVLPFLIVTATLLELGQLVVSGEIGIGDFVIGAAVLNQVHMTTQLLFMTLARFGQHVPYISHLLAFMTEYEVDSGNPQAREVGPVAGVARSPASSKRQSVLDSCTLEGLSIAFENVTFTYPGSSRPVGPLNFRISAGERVAIVGLNGSGKSTLVKLLAGLYRPDGGTILIGGQDVTRSGTAYRRQIMNVMPQEYGRYELSVMRNIGIGSVDHVDDAIRVQRAAGMAGATDLLNRDTRANSVGPWRDLAGLSGGEWQKVALARAFMRDCPIIVLDEPASALDPIAEGDFFARIARLTKEKTVLYITHRVATARRAARIFVMDGGNIVEQGPHEELIKLDGKYAELFSVSMEAN